MSFFFASSIRYNYNATLAAVVYKNIDSFTFIDRSDLLMSGHDIYFRELQCNINFTWLVSLPTAFRTDVQKLTASCLVPCTFRRLCVWSVMLLYVCVCVPERIVASEILCSSSLLCLVTLFKRSQAWSWQRDFLKSTRVRWSLERTSPSLVNNGCFDNTVARENFAQHHYHVPRMAMESPIVSPFFIVTQSWKESLSVEVPCNSGCRDRNMKRLDLM